MAHVSTNRMYYISNNTDSTKKNICLTIGYVNSKFLFVTNSHDYSNYYNLTNFVQTWLDEFNDCMFSNKYELQLDVGNISMLWPYVFENIPVIRAFHPVLNLYQNNAGDIGPTFSMRNHFVFTLV